MIAVFEGVDCSGKSEAALGVTKALDCLYYATPPEPYKSRRGDVDAVATDREHYWFYVAAVQAASNELFTLVTEHPLVIVDRYWMTTVAYHRAAGVTANISDFGAIVLPDLTVYFEVSPEEQRRRMDTRGMSVCDRRQISYQDRVRLEYEKLLASEPVVIRVNTSSMDKAATMKFVLPIFSPVSR